MSLRHIPPEMDSKKIALIDATLDRVVDEHRVFLPFAIESGSRAWGFASPDSDYDCRFIFVRRVAARLTPWSLRDVIELPLEDTLMAECDPLPELREEVLDLMERKAATRELGTGPLSPVVARFIDSEFELARGVFDKGPMRASAELILQAEHFYRMAVERLEQGADSPHPLHPGGGGFA